MSGRERWHVCVLIPARDEEQLLPRCLQSVLAAKAHLKLRATVDIVVVADSSTDQTARIATDSLWGHGTVRYTDVGLVGSARALAAETALARYRGPLERCWLSNTDADCVVPRLWLQQQIEFANDGIQAIAGTVNVDNFADHGPLVPQRFKASYLVTPDGRHSHVHGANLGVRADSYVKSGGWAPLGTAEDHDLWQRLSMAKARMLSTNQIEILTSGRRIGRAPHGFADALSAHNETAA